MTEKSIKLTVNLLYLLCATLKKEGHGDKVVNVGYDSNYVYTNMGLYSELNIDENEVWIDEYDHYDIHSGYRADNCVEDYLKKYGEVK